MNLHVRISKIEVLIESGKIQNHREVSWNFAHQVNGNFDINKLWDWMEEFLRTRPKYDGWMQSFETRCDVEIREEWESDVMRRRYHGVKDVFGVEAAVMDVFRKMCEEIPQKDVYDLDFDDYLVRQLFGEWM